jgi:hypothetical protein
MEEWISVKDSLPEMDIPVFVWCENSMPPIMVCRRWRSSEPGQCDHWYLDNIFYHNIQAMYPDHYPKFEIWNIVTHWRPIFPPPPNKASS